VVRENSIEPIRKPAKEVTGKEIILERIRQNKPREKPLPESFSKGRVILTSDQLIVRFSKNLEKAGAELVECENEEEINNLLTANFEDNLIDLRNPETKTNYAIAVSKEELGKTQALVIEGQFGVAENGAIWIDETNFPDRLLPFITEKLVVILNRGNIVSDMREAYRKVNLTNTGFGVFISGPSKTADIEQSLVYGAHGAKTMSILIC